MKNKIQRSKEYAVNKEKDQFEQLELFPGWKTSIPNMEEREQEGSSKGQEKAEKAENATAGQLSIMDEAERRHSYVTAIDGRYVSEATKSVLSNIKSVAKTINDKYLPLPITVSRWRQRFAASGESTSSPAPSLEMKGNRSRRISAEVFNVIDQAIREVSVMSKSSPATLIHRIVAHKIMQENKVRATRDALVLPSYRTVCKMRRQVMDYRNVYMRYGKRSAYARTSTLKAGICPKVRKTESGALGDGKKRGNNLIFGRAPPKKPGISKMLAGEIARTLYLVVTNSAWRGGTIVKLERQKTSKKED